MRPDLAFERGYDAPISHGRWNTYFDENANDWYNYESAEALVEDHEALEGMITDFLKVQVPRLSVLATYANGTNYGITRRPGRLEENKSDHRARHNYGGFIATFHTGYLFGNPVKIGAANEEEQEEIDAFNTHNHIHELNANLGYDCSRFGRAYELHYRDLQDRDRVVLSSAFETFVIYDETIEHKPIAAVRVVRIQRKGEERLRVTLYTDQEKITYAPAKIENMQLREEERKPHYYGAVPIIEWSNNRFRQGDYESVISQIDLYDAAQSDTANYMNDLNDALLLIKGAIDEAGIDPEAVRQMKDANILLLRYGQNASGQPLPVDAGYIYKQYDVQGTEAYKTRLQADIHRFSYTPDLSDKNFAGNSSGVAMRYKMLGAEQIRSTKEQLFTKSIQQRYQLVDGLRQALHAPRICSEALTISFTENLPVDYWQDVQAYLQAGGQLSRKTLSELLPWIGSFEDEEKRIHEEEEKDDLMHCSCGDEHEHRHEDNELGETTRLL